MIRISQQSPLNEYVFSVADKNNTLVRTSEIKIHVIDEIYVKVQHSETCERY